MPGRRAARPRRTTPRRPRPRRLVSQQPGRRGGGGGPTRTFGGDPAGDWRPLLSAPERPDSLGRIGHYEVLELLGRGGFGIVFRAFDDVLQRVVAVKLLSPRLAATSPARKRFLREARSSAGIRHENVVQVYAVEERPTPFLVMEYVPGETLEQRIARTGPLPADEVVRIGVQAAAGLAAAHAAGVVHRDIKPGNILVEGDPPRVKITDFGLARTTYDASQTHSATLAGTPLYMAPEQVRGEPTDHRADLFSLGSVLYALLTGHSPFRAETTYAVLKRVADDTPRPVRDLIPEVPGWLCEVVERLHAKNPADRVQTAGELIRVLSDGPNGVPARGRSRSSVRRRAWGYAAAVAAAVVVCVLAALPVRGPRPVAAGADDAPSPAQDSPTASPPDAAAPVRDFVAAHALTPERFEAWLDTEARGYRPHWVDVQSHSGRASISAVAVRSAAAEPPYELRRPVADTTHDEITKDWDRGMERGFRVVWDWRYADAGRIFRTRLWTKDGQPSGNRHKTAATSTSHITDEADRILREGFTLSAITPFATAAGMEFILSTNSHRRPMTYRLGATRREAEEYIRQASERGWSLDQLTAYPDAAGERFVVIGSLNSGKPASTVEWAIPPREFPARIAEQKARGVMPWCVTAYGGALATTYAVVWCPFAPAPAPPGKNFADRPAATTPFDQRAYLPLSEGVERRVLDFKEVHGVSPQELVTWAEALDPAYIPLELGDHPTAEPYQCHAVAVKLSSPPMKWRCWLCPASEDTAACPVRKTIPNARGVVCNSYSIHPLGHHTLQVYVSDSHPAGYWSPPNRQTDKQLAEYRRASMRPSMILPCYRRTPSVTLFHVVAASGRDKWQFAYDISLAELGVFADNARKQDLCVALVRAYRDEKGRTRFTATALENPAGAESELETDLTTRQYEDALPARRRAGFRPSAVTSYGDPKDPRYAVAWVEYAR